MADAVELVKIIKKAALEVIKAEKPVEINFGKVISASPLKIFVEQKTILGEKQLILPERLTDFAVEITVDSKKKNITVCNGLAAGDEVILLRQQGGQKYLIADRAT